MPNQINLETERLWLREFKWKDVSNIHKLHSIPEVARFNTLGIPKEIRETRDHISFAIEDQEKVERRIYSWCILHPDSQEFMGEAGMSLAPQRYRKGEIHYSLLPEFWGKGYATELAKGIISFGFEALNLHRIEAGVAVDNEQSIRVLEKVGMQKEGRKRKILPLSSGWSDNFTYAILEDDPREY